MSDFPPYRTSRACLFLEHCYWSTLLAALPWILALGWSGLSVRRTVGIAELIAGLGSIVVWTQSWLTVPVLWVMVLAWCIREIRRTVGRRHAPDAWGRVDFLVRLAPEWLLACAAADVTSLVVFERWTIAAVGGPEEDPHRDPGYDQSRSYAGIYLIALMLPAVLAVARPWLVLNLRHLIAQVLPAASTITDGDHSHTEPIGRKAVAAQSGWFLEHGICTILTSSMLVGLGRWQLLPCDSYVLGEVLQTPTNLLVAALWLQGLVTIPMAWTIGALSCGKWVLRFVTRTRGIGGNATTRKRGLNLASWIVTCAIAAWLCAEIGISGNFSIDSPEGPELRQQAWVEFVAISLLPLLLQLGIKAAKRLLRMWRGVQGRSGKIDKSFEKSS